MYVCLKITTYCLQQNILCILGIYFDVPEITPNAVGVFRFDCDNEKVHFVNFFVHLWLCIYINDRFLAYYTGHMECQQTDCCNCLASIKHVLMSDWTVSTVSTPFNLPDLVQLKETSCLCLV